MASRENVTNLAFDRLLKLGIDTKTGTWGPTPHADKAVSAFHRLTERLTAGQLYDLANLLDEIKHNQDAEVEQIVVPVQPVPAPYSPEDSPFYCEPCGMAHDPFDPTCRKRRK